MSYSIAALAGSSLSPIADFSTMMFANFGEMPSAAALAALGQVILIDVVLAGDNAIAVGALAAGLPAHQRRRVILVGILAALLLRIIFALLVSQLMQIVGLVFAGGLLLLWVAWKMMRELSGASDADTAHGVPKARSFAAAVMAVTAADLSMSLDNVLAVGGAAREHPGILALGLLLSVILMGVAANMIAEVIDRHRWIAYLGVAVILYVAARMIWEGLTDPVTGVWHLLP